MKVEGGVVGHKEKENGTLSTGCKKKGKNQGLARRSPTDKAQGEGVITGLPFWMSRKEENRK